MEPLGSGPLEQHASQVERHQQPANDNMSMIGTMPTRIMQLETENGDDDEDDDGAGDDDNDTGED